MGEGGTRVGCVLILCGTACEDGWLTFSVGLRVDADTRHITTRQPR